MRKSSRQRTLTETTYHRGLATLVEQDPALASVLEKWGNPPFWIHEPGFPGIINAILAQQVSLESARATFSKLENQVNSVNPEEILALSDGTLKTIGFSRQKTAYIRGVALGIMAGDIELNILESMCNEDVRESLIRIRGIGIWTADTYLLFSLRRADAWPSGDLALAKAIQELRENSTMPDWEQVDRIAEQWRPWRAVAARILWHYYLCERGRTVSL